MSDITLWHGVALTVLAYIIGYQVFAAAAGLPLKPTSWKTWAWELGSWWAAITLGGLVGLSWWLSLVCWLVCAVGLAVLRAVSLTRTGRDVFR
jgi:hypothetical protein